MNTLMSGMGVPCTGTLRASVLSDSWAFGASATNCLMRALVPLGEKSSESVPERVLPYRHINNWCIQQIRICTHKRMGREWQLSRPICNGSSNNTPWSFRLATRRGAELAYLIYIFQWQAEAYHWIYHSNSDSTSTEINLPSTSYPSYALTEAGTVRWSWTG